MRHQILAIRDPVWSNEQKTRINCMVRFLAYRDELPFTASPDDPEEHGREIFRRCVAGQFGEIGPYLDPPTKADKAIAVSLPRWAAAWPEVHEFLVEANAENERETPRGIGLVWGSMLETMLETFVQGELKRLRRGRRTLRCPPCQKCPKGRKCGTTFKDLIDGAVYESLIEQDLGRHLHAIREIRNACAHEWRLNFSNPKVGALQDNFDILRSAYFPEFMPNDFESMMKMVFSSSCCRIVIILAEISAQQAV